MEPIHELAVRDFADLVGALLEKSCTVRFRAKGTSMLPLIHNGDILSVQRHHQIKRGDVVLYSAQEGHCMAHRVIQRWPDSDYPQEVMLQGDALLQRDGILPATGVLGTVIALERGGKVSRLDQGWRHWWGCIWASMSPKVRRLHHRLRHVAAQWHLRFNTPPGDASAPHLINDTSGWTDHPDPRRGEQTVQPPPTERIA